MGQWYETEECDCEFCPGHTELVFYWEGPQTKEAFDRGEFQRKLWASIIYGPILIKHQLESVFDHIKPEEY